MLQPTTNAANRADAIERDASPRGPAPRGHDALDIADQARPGAPRPLFEPGRNCMAVARAARAAMLVDGEAYYRAFADAALKARRSLTIVGWDFDSRAMLGEKPIAPGVPTALGEFLNFLVKRRRGLVVRVLDWDYPMVFGTDRETRPIYGLGWKPHRRVQLHYDNTHPVGASHHQKIVVVDDTVAFCGGLDLTGRRWDTCGHEASDHRRTLDGKAYPPFHDVMACVDGEAAAVLAQVVRERWQRATGHDIPPATTDVDPWPADIEPLFTDVDVAVSRTVPKAADRDEVREIEALYVDMIAAAKRCIYLENQYFTSDRIGQALARRLAEPEPPEIVLVTRLLSHGWLEENTMHVLRTRLIRMLKDADHAGRFEVYYPHVPDLADGTCVDCHSKVIAVDDAWLRVGSANLSNRSMGLDTECDLTFEAAGRRDLADGVLRARDTLIAEHLGVPVERLQQVIARTASVHAAIRELACEKRTLRVLERTSEPSEALMTLASVADPERPVSIDQLVDQFSPDTEMHPHGPAWGKIALVAVIVAGLAAAWRFTPLREFLTPERAFDFAQAIGMTWWAPLAVIVAYTPAAFTMFPRPLITLFAVVAFGPWWGFAYALAGIVVSALATYYVGRVLPRDTVRRLAGDRLNAMTDALRRRGLVAVLAVRIVPVAPYAVEGIVAGAVRIRVFDYTAGTVLGMLPGTLTTTVFGDQIQTALEDPSRINYGLVALVVAFFVVLTFLVRRWFLREHRKATAAA